MTNNFAFSKKNILLIFLLLLSMFSCKSMSEQDSVKLVVQAYDIYVKDRGEQPDLKNVPQYLMILPQKQDELAIEIVPYLKKVLATNKISRRLFAKSISRALTTHKYAIKLDTEIKKINPYFDGDMYGIIKKALEYLRRGLPTLRDTKSGEIGLFNYTDFIIALRKARFLWKSQNFATLFFFHNENDRYKIEKILKNLRKNIPYLVRVAKLLNVSGLQLYKMEYLRFYELIFNQLINQINLSPPPNVIKVTQEYLFFIAYEINVGKYQMTFPDFQKVIQNKIKFNAIGNTVNTKFKNGKTLKFTKEGKYWRLPKLPDIFWELPFFKTK